jgi:hypothetical protein
MGAVTQVGLLFAEPWNKPLSTAGKFQTGCYLVFTNAAGTLLPVYRDPALLWPYNQTSIPGSGPQVENAIVSGIASDATGAFRPIYLNPSLQYSYTLFSSSGAVLEGPTTAVTTSINVPNTQQVIQAQKISTSSRSNTVALANDPDLQISLAAGVYRLEMDLIWVSSAASGDNIQFEIAYSTTNGVQPLLAFGLMNNASFDSILAINATSASVAINNVPNQNILHVVGSVQFTTAGTVSIKWAQGTASTDVVSLCVGSALYATPL